MAKTAKYRWRGFGSRTSLNQPPTYKSHSKKKPKSINGFISFRAKFNGTCSCGNKIRQGKLIWYNRNLKIANCYPCGPHIVK